MPTFTAPDGSPVTLTPEQQTQALSLASAATPEATFTRPDGTPVTLAPEQQSQALQQAQSPAPMLSRPDGTPLDVTSLHAEQLAELNKQEPGFDLPSVWNSLPAEQKTPDALARFSEASHLVHQQPFSLPTVTKMLSNLWQLAKGGGEMISNLAKGGALIVGGYPGAGTWMDPQKVKEVQQGIAEGWSGTESAVTGLANQLKETVVRHVIQPPNTLDPAVKQQNFLDEAAMADQQSQILKGRGEFMNRVGGDEISYLESQGFPVRPEHAANLAQVDPFTFYLFGKAFDALPAATKAAIPTPILDAIQKASDTATDTAKQIVGGGAAATAAVLQGVGAGVTKAAPHIGRPAAAIAGGIHAGVPGAVTGLVFGKGMTESLSEMGKKIASAAKGTAKFGEGVSSEAATGPVSQAAKDIIEAAPGALAGVAQGAALDVGLQAATAETPQQQQSFTPVGTAMGLTHGAMSAGKWMLGGQLAGERNWGATAGVPNSAAFPALNTLHNAAMSAAPPKIQERIRAIQQLKQGVNPNTDVFYIPDPVGVMAALGATPGAEQHAFQAGAANGVFLKDLPGANGQKRNAIIFQNVDAAPHEAVHAMDAALGAERVNELNQSAKSDYGDLWDQFTSHYANLLNGGQPLPEGTTPGDFLLQQSGFGPEAARNKTGGDGSDWQTALTPDEKQNAIDRYIGAEIRAENGDAYFKRTGGKAPGFTDKMANAAGELVSLLGGNPLEGRVSSGLQLPLRWDTFKQAGQTLAEARANVPPALRPVARTPLTTKTVPTTPEEIQQNADDARVIAGQQPAEKPTGAEGEQSPKEALGTVAEAIASQSPVRYQYRGAAGETPTGGALETDVSQRQAEIAKAQNVSETDRDLFERVGFPYKVEMTGKGPQVLDWAPVNLAANAFRWSKALSELAKKNPNAPELARNPFALDVAKGEFTTEGWHDLLDTAQKVSANQLAGFGGAGQKIVVPSDLGAANVYAPPRVSETAPFQVDQAKADFINMLYGERPPETPRVSRKSGVPANVVAQKISAATEPGRVVEPAKIRAKPKQAAGLGVEPGTLIERAPFKEPILGVPTIQEVNPTRGALENALQSAGVEIPKMTKVIRRLNLEHIHSVQPEPNLPRTAGANVLTTTAGFMPVTDFVDRLDKTSPDDWRNMVTNYQGRFGGGQTGLSIEVGAGAKSPEEVAALQSATERQSELMRGALKNRDFQTAAGYAIKAQAAREAHEAATGGGGMPDFLQRYHPEAGYKPPFPESTLQAAPRNEDVAKVAEDYVGRPLRPIGNLPISPDLGKRLADFAQEAQHNPDDPAVKASYGALNAQIKQQYDAIRKAGYTVEPWTGAGEPYKSSAEMSADVRDNKHLFFTPTARSFSGQENNLMLQPSGVGDLSHNDLFRAVHDFFGHAKEGLQFGPRGEYNAWREHSQMFSPEAQGALAAETLAQNAFVNFGSHLRNAEGNIPAVGEPGYVPPAQRPFAEQKNFVVPSELRKAAQFQPLPPGAGKALDWRDLGNDTLAPGLHIEAIAGKPPAVPISQLQKEGWKTMDFQDNGSFHDYDNRPVFYKDNTGKFPVTPDGVKAASEAASKAFDEAQNLAFEDRYGEGPVQYQPRPIEEARSEPKTILIRHGTTALNNTDPTKDLIRGHKNVQLSEEGRQQAAELGQQLKTSGISRIYSSDLDRTMDTAKEVAKTTGAPITPDARLRPWKLGSTIEGKPTADMLPRIKSLTESPDERPPGGETFNEFKDRFLEGYHAIQDAHPNEHTAIVTHYRGTKLMDAWRAAGVDNDEVKPDVFDAYDPHKKPGSYQVLDKQGNELPLDTARPEGAPITHLSDAELNSAPGMTREQTLAAERGGTQPAQFKPREKQEKEIELRHWSNIPGLKVLDPRFHGTGLSGEERARARDYKEIYVPRTYFGTKDYTKEPNLGPEQYRAFVQRSKLYPFQEDPKDLWPTPEEVEKAGYAPMDSRAANTLYENKIAQAGYEGYIHRDAKVAAKFTKTPVEYLGSMAQFSPSTKPRAIRAAAVQDKDTGQIFEGFAHFDAHGKMLDAGYNPHDLFQHPQGFVTNEGEFLDREQALKRARELDQIRPSYAENKTRTRAIAEAIDMAAKPPSSAEPAGPAQFKPAGAPKLEDFQSEDKIAKALARPGWALLTATEERKGPGTAPVNVKANERLSDRLAQLGYDFTPVAGSYKGIDQGQNFLVTGISPQDALTLGKEFNQESVLTPAGLVYQDGSVHPAKPEETTIGKAAKKNDFYSQVQGGPAFSMGIDFENKIPASEAPVPAARPEQQMMGGEFSPTKELAGNQMSPTELKEHYPEAIVVPDKENGKPVGIPSDIKESPLYKEHETEAEAVDTFAKRLADFARQYKDNPAYKDGLRWYSEFVPLLKKHFGEHAQIMAELLAATSPQNNPQQNFAMANDALEMWKRGKFDKQLAKFEEGAKKIEDGTWKDSGAPTEAKFMADWIDEHDLKPRQSNGKLYNMHSVPVLQVLARKWLENTGGPKTQNFVKNLLGTGHGATYDVWADRTLRRIGYSGHQARWRILPKNAVGVSDADFAFGQKVFAKAAKELGVRPDSLQGGLWFAEKQLWADNGWGRLDLGDFRKEIQNRELLNRGIVQRLAATEAAQQAPQTAQSGFDLGMIEPRPIR